MQRGGLEQIDTARASTAHTTDNQLRASRLQYPLDELQSCRSVLFPSWLNLVWWEDEPALCLRARTQLNGKRGDTIDTVSPVGRVTRCRV
jgi:hypothetical protein